MSTLSIKDLATNKELDCEAMTEVVGGSGFGSFSLLSPSFYNMATPINGAVAAPTWQTNNLVQVDENYATNRHGINVISNNKFAYQGNSNHIADFLSPAVYG